MQKHSFFSPILTLEQVLEELYLNSYAVLGHPMLFLLIY